MLQNGCLSSGNLKEETGTRSTTIIRSFWVVAVCVLHVIRFPYKLRVSAVG